MRLIVPLVVLLVLSAGLLALGWAHAERQRAALDHEARPARVVTADIARQPLGGYTPRVVYQYRHDDRVHESHRFMPLPAAGNLAWARQEAERFKPGEATTVYVSPMGKPRAYLVQVARFYPYILILLPSVGLGLALAGLLRCGFFEPRPRAEKRGPFDWYHIPASRVTSARGILTAGFVAMWYLYGLLALGHYLLVAECITHHAPATGVFSAYALAGLPMLASVVRHRRLERLMADAALSATLPSFRTDGLVTVKLAQRVLHEVCIKDATLNLVCEQRRGLFASERMFVNSIQLGRDARLQPHQWLEGECRFEIPPRKRRPSSPFSRWAYPRTDWLVELKIQLVGGGRYRVTYPVHVEAHTARHDPVKNANAAAPPSAAAAA